MCRKLKALSQIHLLLPSYDKTNNIDTLTNMITICSLNKLNHHSKMLTIAQIQSEKNKPLDESSSAQPVHSVGLTYL